MQSIYTLIKQSALRKRLLLFLLSPLLLFLAFLPTTTIAQSHARVVVGYWHNWSTPAVYVPLRDVDPKYNVVQIAFAESTSHSNMTMKFAPEVQSEAEFIADMRILQSQGRKVLISIGGQNGHIEINTAEQKQQFVSSMKAIINHYGFDGFDIDVEGGSSLALNPGDLDFKNPTTPKMVNLIAACKEIVNDLRSQGKDIWLTAAPEVQYVQGAYGHYGGAYGSYIPFLHGVRDILTFVHVQYYNTPGGTTGLDDKIYYQGTPDFVVAMTEMLLKGFPVARDQNKIFPPLREDQVAFGLPANTNAAGSGFLAHADGIKALDYLIKGISFGGSYITAKAYPNFRGVMTWSVNWDKTSGNAFANTYRPYFNALSGGNQPPVVSITSPSNNATFASGASITIEANATDGDGTISKVEFFNGSTKLGEDTSSPYTYTWAGAADGNYSLTAKATDDKNAVATSTAVNISIGEPTENTPPTVSITDPANGAEFEEGETITITASANDSDGSIAKVDFFSNGTKLGESSTAPYTFVLSNATAGSYSFTATATDDQGASTTSAAVAIVVTSTSNPGGCDAAQYVENGGYAAGSQVQNEGNVYTCKDYPYSGWCNGAAWAYAPGSGAHWQDAWTLEGECTGGGDENQAPSASITSPANNATFEVGQTITITANASDSDGTIAKVEFYIGTTKISESSSSPYRHTWTATQGSHSISVVATDNKGTKTTSGIVNITVNDPVGNNPPSVNITAPTDGQEFMANQTITITANATDSDGNIVKVVFLVDDAIIGEASSLPYNMQWTTIEGNHTLKAVAHDDDGATTVSRTVSIRVKQTDNDDDGNNNDCAAPQFVAGTPYQQGDEVYNNNTLYKCEVGGWCSLGGAYEPGIGWAWNYAWTSIGECTGNDNGNPTVSITAPAANANFNVGENVTIAVKANDADGQVEIVEFFVNGTKIGEDNSSPYSITWTATQGSHTLVAKATDDSHNTTESEPVRISVGTNNPPSGDLPTRILSGYWHTWGGGPSGGVPFIKLRDVSKKWDVINISFAEPVSPGSSNGQMKFEVSGAPADYSNADFKTDIQMLQNEGKKIVISIGGYEGYFHLNNTAARDRFVSDMISMIDEYGFDGIDIDLEQSSLELQVGDNDIDNPTSPKVVNTIAAIRTICNHYGDDFMLTFAPEAFYLQLGYQWYGGIHSGADRRAGVYIPVIHNLRDKLTYVQAQLYNQPAVMALDGKMYSSGNADYLVSMTEMLLKGFNVGGDPNNFFPPLRADQVLFGVPASTGAAGSGLVSTQELQKAFDYLVKGTPAGGSYTTSGTYPALRGIMTWSINWDEFQNNGAFVNSHRAYLDALPSGTTASYEIATQTKAEFMAISYPNPFITGTKIVFQLSEGKYTVIAIYNESGEKVDVLVDGYLDEGHYTFEWKAPNAPSGMYFYKITSGKEVKTLKVFKQ